VVRRIFNIKPEHVHRNILLVKSLVNSPNIVAADIVPSALVISQAELGWGDGGTSESGVLGESLIGKGGKDEQIKDTGLGDPVDFSELCDTSIQVSEPTTWNTEIAQ
jgi:hypothetical protein